MLGCIFFSLLTVSTNAAEAPAVQPRWTNTNSMGFAISFNGNMGYLNTSITGLPGTTNNTADVKLYYKDANGNWVDTNLSWHYDEDMMLLRKNETFTGVVGREYKAELTATVLKDGYREPLSKTATDICD